MNSTSAATLGQVMLGTAQVKALAGANFLTDHHRKIYEAILDRNRRRLSLDSNGIFTDLHTAGASRETLKEITVCLDAATDQERKVMPITWPELRREALPGIVGDFIDAACMNSEADPAAVLATFLTRFSILVGADHHFQVADAKHPPRLNVVVVGDSSKARKGTSEKPVGATFEAYHTQHPDNACRVSPGPLSSGEGIVFAVRDEQQTWILDKKSGSGQWQVTDPGVTDKRLFVQDEEFAAALQCSKREGNTLSAIIRTLTDSGSCEPLTKGNRIKTTGAHVGIATHITFAELKKLLSENDQLNGFGNRFLWVCAKRQKMVPIPSPLDEQVKAEVVDAIHAATMNPVKQFIFSKQAERLWIDSYHDLSEAIGGRAGAMVARGEMFVVRLALIYALLACHRQIEVDDLRAALAFWDYCQQSALFIFAGETPLTNRRKKLLDAIPEEGCTRTDLYNAFDKHIKKADLDVLLTELEQAGKIVLDKEPTAGAPRTKINKVLSEISRISEISPPEAISTQLNSHNSPNSHSDEKKLDDYSVEEFDWQEVSG